VRYTRQVEAGMDEIFLSAGDHLDHQIEKVICKSLCYIVVFTKTYIDEINPYCARELASILRHQNERFNKLREFGPKGLDGYNLIIPIILSGSFEGFPKVLKNKGVLSFDFSRRSLWLDEGITFDTLLYTLMRKQQFPRVMVAFCQDFQQKVQQIGQNVQRVLQIVEPKAEQ
jgi:hypothetical protein